MKRRSDHRGDIAEKRVCQHPDRAGFPQSLRHTESAAHEEKDQKIDFADLVLCQDTYAWKCRGEPDAHTDNGRIQVMDEIRGPDTHTHHHPKCGLLLRGAPPSKPR